MVKISDLITSASSRADAMQRLRDADLKEPKEGTTSGVGYNAYEYMKTGQERFFDEVEQYYVKQTRRASNPIPDFYATREEPSGQKGLEMTKQEAETGSPNTKTQLRTPGQREAEAKVTASAKEDSSDEAMAIMSDTTQSVDELRDLMGQVDDLKQDEADLKTKIERAPTDTERDELKRNMGEVIEKRRAVEETAQMTLNEVRTAPGKMQDVDPSKVADMEKLAKEAEEMGGDRPPKQTVEVDPTMDKAMPTMSPDEMEEVAEGMRKASEEADRKAEEERARVRMEMGEREARRREQPRTQASKGTDGPQMTITRSKASTVPDDIQPLPMERISTKNKSLAELLDDLKYFFNTYPDTLRRETEKYEKLDKMSMPLVERFHKRIVGKLYDPKRSRERVGIILDAREYIAQQVNDILAKRATDGLKPEEIVSITDPEKKPDVQDYGVFEVKEGRDGGEAFYRREPLYRLMPETNEKQVYPMEAKAKKGRLRVGPPPTKYNSLVQNAKVEFKQNPFTEPKKDIVRLQF